MFTSYKLTILLKENNDIIDSVMLEYSNKLKRVEIVKKVRTYLGYIGYNTKYYKFSLKKV